MDLRDQQLLFGELLPRGAVFNEKDMSISFELEDGDGLIQTHTLPAVYVVCDLCRGKGTHVNPSIDSHGISLSEFYEDPDFAKEYFNGLYDVLCYRCNGMRVIPEIDRERKTEELKVLDNWMDFEIQYRHECIAEKRMGA